MTADLTAETTEALVERVRNRLVPDAAGRDAEGCLAELQRRLEGSQLWQ